MHAAWPEHDQFNPPQMPAISLQGLTGIGANTCLPKWKAFTAFKRTITKLCAMPYVDTEPARLDTVRKDHWHLDKKVPIMLIIALAGHLGGSIWFFRGMVAELHETQRRVTVLESARLAERVSERLAVVEAQVADTKAATLRVEANVQKLVERK
jgi:hypothetical protein